jgi:nitronate monooxygenase
MTTLQQLFGIQFPIVQAPMAGVQGSELALAVSNAGGLGSLPCATIGLDTIGQELQRMRDGTTQPFNVNFFAHQLPREDAAHQQQWHDALSPYYHELGLDPADLPTGAQRLPFNRDMALLIQEFKPAVVSFHFGLPAPELVAMVRQAGSKIMASATTVEEALWLEQRGVDAIIAQGQEAGGHRGMFLSTDTRTQISTFALVPQVAKAVKVPVIAAGGVADAQGVCAMMALGAAGVQVGTTFLLCPEAKTSAVHRAALKSDAARITAITNVFTGRPARSIVNRIVRELGILSPKAPAFPLAATAMAPLRVAAEKQGSADFSPLWAGQNVSGCKEIPAAELMRQLAGQM